MKIRHTLLVILTCLIAFSSCDNEITEEFVPIEIDPAFAEYISAYTSGVISKKANIRIRLADKFTGSIDKEKPIPQKLFVFDPAVKGEAYWIDSRTAEFRPAEALQSGAIYTGHFFLNQVTEVPDGYQQFAFQFRSIKQDFHVYVDGLESYNTNSQEWQQIQGRVSFADDVDSLKMRSVFAAKQGNEELNIKWKYEGDNIHHFMIDSVIRKKTPGQVLMSWNGKAIDVERKEERAIAVPALGDFSIGAIEVHNEPEQYLEIRFTDPIKPKQNLRGIIKIGNERDLQYSIDGHKVSVFPSSRITGTETVTVTRGIKNFFDYKMAVREELDVQFESLNPEVRMVGTGNIVPHSGGVLMPFEAVSLNAVDVQVFQIFEENITQFLQVNDLDGNQELKRVGRKIYTKTVRLDTDKKINLNEWNRFYVDLTSLVNKDPGAMYRVELRFNKENSIYACVDEDDETDDPNAALQRLAASAEEEWSEDDWGSNSYYYDNDYWYYDDYDWYERDNPCHNSYYRGMSTSRNILASDIGIIAKAGGDKIMHVTLNNLLDTKPLSGATVEFYDYQQQLIGSAVTDANGMVSKKLKRKPFLLVAKHDSQQGYLRLRDGEALSLSKFEVDGKQVQKGIKGFVYGERGVWRPGDSIYLSFIMEDKEHLLPKSHPVNFEFVNPHGQVIETQVKTSGVNGFYDFRTKTAAEAPTGNYLARIKVGNRTFSKSVKVETVKPNRLKIYLDFGKDKLSRSDENPKAKLNVKWLHGAVARSLRADIKVTVNPTKTKFDNFKGYVFDDPTQNFHVQDETIFNSKIDGEGNAMFNTSLSIGSAAPGMLKAYFTTRVYEESGNFSIDRFSLPYSPYTDYVGVQVPKGELYMGTLETDKSYYIDVASVTDAGKGTSRKDLKVKVFKLDWRWWWDSYDNSIASYIGRTSTVPVLDKTVSTSRGKGRFKFKVRKADWGRYFIQVSDPKSGHITGKVIYVDWPYHARTNRTDNEFATMLNFSADKDNYVVGETVKLSFPSGSAGRALVCVESGTKVLQKFWVETQKGETKCEFTTSADMAPNVFVHVTLLQPHNETKNDLPIRMYGIVPIAVEDPTTHLKPTIEMPKVLRPESTVNVKVKEENGKPMTYTLAMVDEGLLDLTGFKTPQPWKHFYAKEALGVKTWDLYDKVMGSYAAELNRILAIGGDGYNDRGDSKAAKANRFKPMVRYIGPFELPANGTGQHKIRIPNYIGSVRVMVVAGQDAAYGQTEETVAVRNPLMVLGTLPRVLGPTETVQLPVNVFAMEKHVKNVSIEIQADDMFVVDGETKRSIKFDKIGDEVINFKMKVANRLGIGKVKIIARSGKEKAVHEIELDVRSPNPEVHDVQQIVIEPGKTWNPNFTFTGIRGTNSAVLELSAMPPINLESRLKYLVQYPHGCVEQTTSGAFPQLYLSDILQLDSKYKARISRNIKAAVKRLQLFQTPEGGFAYWPGERENSFWGSNYAGHFIVEAEEQGYRLPAGMKKRWLKYQRKIARNYQHGVVGDTWRYSRSDSRGLSQAYRLYTLALAGSPELGAMNRLREQPDLAATARYRLAAAYQMVGQTEVAEQLIHGLSTKVKAYTELSYSYGSSTRDEAMILETLSLMDRKAKAGDLAKRIAKSMNDESKWMSTQTTAYCLIAMSKFVGSNGQSKFMQFSYQVNDRKPVVERTQVAIYQKQILEKDALGGGAVTVTNNGEGILYAKFVTTGIPTVGDQSKSANDVKISVNYKRMDGKYLDPKRLQQGTDFIAEVTIHNPGSKGDLKEMTLNQIFPSGWEIHNARMSEGRSSMRSDAVRYQDIRDDRVYTYYDLERHKKKTFRIQLSATYLGRFYLPTVMTEAMYDEGINARVPGQWIEVVKPEGKPSS